MLPDQRHTDRTGGSYRLRRCPVAPSLLGPVCCRQVSPWRKRYDGIRRHTMSVVGWALEPVCRHGRRPETQFRAVQTTRCPVWSTVFRRGRAERSCVSLSSTSLGKTRRNLATQTRTRDLIALRMWSKSAASISIQPQLDNPPAHDGRSGRLPPRGRPETQFRAGQTTRPRTMRAVGVCRHEGCPKRSFGQGKRPARPRWAQWAFAAALRTPARHATLRRGRQRILGPRMPGILPAHLAPQCGVGGAPERDQIGGHLQRSAGR